MDERLYTTDPHYRARIIAQRPIPAKYARRPAAVRGSLWELIGVLAFVIVACAGILAGLAWCLS